jgi:phosphatidylserine/phosphatidylglycerophosphate/cardiolipin synthase-like enzyme
MIPRIFGWVFAVVTLGQAFETVKNTLLNVYVYKHWIHSKVFDFDGVAVAVGSFNFDETSAHWMEDTLICMDKELNEKASSMLASDFSHSYSLPKATEN